MDKFASKEFWAVVIGGSTLALIAGFINAVSLTGLYTSTVSHVTGNVTKIGLFLLDGDFNEFGLVASLVLSFMVGSFVSGFMLGNSKFQLGRGYGVAILIEAFALMLSYLLLRKEFIFGELLAAFACGLQNALATNYSGAALRTTHMTGIATDIGMILGQACTKHGTVEIWKLKVLCPLILGYLFGGILGQLGYKAFGDAALLIPSGVLFAIALFYLSWGTAKQAHSLLTQAVNKLQDEIELGIFKFAVLHGENANNVTETTPKWMEEHRRAEKIDLEIEMLMRELERQESRQGNGDELERPLM